MITGKKVKTAKAKGAPGRIDLTPKKKLAQLEKQAKEATEYADELQSKSEDLQSRAIDFAYDLVYLFEDAATKKINARQRESILNKLGSVITDFNSGLDMGKSIDKAYIVSDELWSKYTDLRREIRQAEQEAVLNSTKFCGNCGCAVGTK